MIGRADIVERVREWGLTEEVVEKDYVLGWLLWGISAHPVLGDQWIFKGGTCLKKCWIETYRFSEDLDFTVLPRGPFRPDDVEPLMLEILREVEQLSGIDLTSRGPQFRLRDTQLSTEGRVYYRGPRQAPSASRIKLDITSDEPLIRPPVLRPISHQYPDALPEQAAIRSYSFDEVFAEKIRAMAQRGRPRDLYDIVNLFRRQDLRLYPTEIRRVLHEKCRAKSIAVPTLDSVLEHQAELEADWDVMLSHQLPALPPVGDFVDELRNLFDWLSSDIQIPTLPAIAMASDEDAGWSPPATAWHWGTQVPLETIRFAAANRLCVDLTYQRSVRRIEPYSLRRTSEGFLVLHALRSDTHEHRSYRVDRMEAVTVTRVPFKPVYAIEFAQMGRINAPSMSRAGAVPYSRSRRPHVGLVYVIECSYCSKRFRRQRYDTQLRAHKAPDGWPCSGRSGFLVDTI